MEKSTIKQIILRQQELISQIQLIERDFPFEPATNYVLVGIRRAGKSFLLYQYIKQLIKEGHSIEEFLFINFEDERINEIKKEELNIIIECYRELYAHKPIIFLDEIQNVEGWEHFARRLADEKYHVLITGSNAKMLSREIASTLGGRYMLKEVYPFRFDEFLKFKNFDIPNNIDFSPRKSDVVRLMNEYLHNGGLSECFNMIDKRGWHQSLYDKILLSDIIIRNNIRNERSIRMLVRKLADSIEQPTAIKRLQNILQGDGTKISRDTISDYLEYLNGAFLTFSISNHTDSLSDKATIKKHYFYDNGILNLFIINPETKLLENQVAIKLYSQYGDRLLYYNKNVEVDFYVPEAKRLTQVSYSIANAETRDREVGAIVKTANFLKADKLEIVTFNEEDSITVGNLTINVVPLWKWLLY